MTVDPSGARPRWWLWLRVAAGPAILAALALRLGARPFLDGFRGVDAASVVLASAIALLTTVCCAWRWALIAGGLGVDLPVRRAIGAYYRSQFLNTTLPGGVLGDVHRAVVHGHEGGDLGRGARIVALERSAGQVVQVALAGIVLLLVPSPVRLSPALVLTVVGICATGGTLLCLQARRGGSSIWARVASTVVRDVRLGILTARAWPGVLIASMAVVLGHLTTFLVAARAAGSTASTLTLLPLALLVLVAMTLPLSIAGWGPREGVAAWVFALAGLGASEGVAAAVLYGVLVLVASLPGAALLTADALRRAAVPPARVDRAPAAAPQVRTAATRV